MSGAYSPRSTITGDTPVTYEYQGRSFDGHAKLGADSTSGGGGLSFGWDQDSEGRFSTAVEATADLAWYKTTQQLESLESSSGREIAVSAIADYCAANPAAGFCRLRSFRQLLVPHTSSLGQVRIGASVTETVARKNDLGLSFAYYLYTDDPTQIGSYSFAVLGRRTGAASVGFGEGISIAPQWFSLRAEYARRLVGDQLQISGSFTFAYYVNDPDGVNQGYELDLGLKLRYNLSKRWRLWASGTAARAVDAIGAVSWSGNGAAGVRAKF